MEENLVKAVMAIVAGISIMFAICVVAFFGGTIVWWLWPYAIPSAFPGLVLKGVLAPKLTWWSAVALTWISILLVKGISTTTNTDTK
jgi:hypothetical protein